MKKIILLCFALCFTLQVFAKDYSSFCSNDSYKKGFKGSISSMTGTSFLERRIIEHQITKALKRETGSKFNADLGTYFGISPISGVFESLELKASDVQYDGIYFSNIQANTICPYNRVQYKDNKLTFVQNSVFQYNATITQNDVNKMLDKSSVSKIVEKMNNDSVISSLIKIKNYNVKIKDDKLVFDYKISPLPKSGNILEHLPIKLSDIDVSFTSGLAVKEGKVELLDFSLNNKKVSYNYLLPIINKFNPTSFSAKLDKNKIQNGKIELDNVEIKDSKIILKGVVIVYSENKDS